MRSNYLRDLNNISQRYKPEASFCRMNTSLDETFFEKLLLRLFHGRELFSREPFDVYIGLDNFDEIVVCIQMSIRVLCGCYRLFLFH